MRAIRNIIFFTVLLASICPSQASLPPVTVKYDAAEDSSCSGSSVKTEWKAELLSREPEFVSLWESEGPRLVAATESISGKDFPSQKITAWLTLCNLPSESFPESGRVTINMRYALRSFTPEPVSIRYKVNTLFTSFSTSFFSDIPSRTRLCCKSTLQRTKECAIICTCWRCKKQCFLRLIKPTH